MNINDLYREVGITLDKVVGKAEFVNCLNTVIRRLNSEAQKHIELVTITGTAYDAIIDLDEAIIDMDDPIGGGGRWKDGFDWDSINYAVSLPRNYAKVLSVFYDDEKMQPVSYDLLKAESTSSYYTTIGNTIYFNTDLSSASAEIKVRAKLDYPVYYSGDEYTGLPENAYHLLVTGILYMLSARPKYYNETALALYKSQFENALYNYNIKVLEKDLKSLDEQPFYTW